MHVMLIIMYISYTDITCVNVYVCAMFIVHVHNIIMLLIYYVSEYTYTYYLYYLLARS